MRHVFLIEALRYESGTLHVKDWPGTLDVHRKRVLGDMGQDLVAA